MTRSLHRRRALIAGTAAAGAVLAPRAFAQAAADWPRQPVKLIVPFPAGGSTDILARLLGKAVAGQIGQPVVIDNRGGAGGIIGVDALAKSPPDGHHFGITSSSALISAPILYDKVPYDADRDFAFVSQVASVPMILCVHPSVPVTTVPELIQHLQRNRGKLAYGSVAIGHIGHVSMVHMDRVLDAGMNHVPYKGEAQMLQDLLANQLPLSFLTVATARPHVEQGRLRVLAIAGTQRHESMPQVPTFAEQGVPDDVYKVVGWLGIIAPARVPAAVVQRMSGEIATAVRGAEVRERLVALGMVPVAGTPEAHAAVFRSDRVMWQKLLRDANVQPGQTG